MWELEAWASAMAWDWDTDDIDLNDNDGKLWVPVMAHMMNIGRAEQHRGPPCLGPVMPPRQMTVYAVQPNRDGSAKQASMLVVMAMQTPRMMGHVVIKSNWGEGESSREEEMTVDEDGEREVSKPREPSKAPAMPRGKISKVKGKTPRMG